MCDKMANVVVKCPVCGRIKVNRRRVEQMTFYCCGLAHNLEKNLVAEGQKRTKKKRVVGEKVDVLRNFLDKYEPKPGAENEAV